MVKGAVLLLADTGTHADLGRAANALETVEQFADVGDEVKLVFDGAGTQWVPVLADEDHDLHPKFQAVRDHVHGACEFCANAFHVRKEIEATDVPLLDEHNQHPDVHALADDGYEIITL